MATKWMIERAVFRDDRGDPDRAWMLDMKPLPSSGRLVMSVLLSRCDTDTGLIDADHTPSLSDLAELTGLDRSTVRRVLNGLERACWVIRHRPDPADARAHGARTGYQLGVPGRDGMPVPVDEEVEAPRPQGRGVTPPPKTEKVGASRPQSGGTAPPPVEAPRPQGRGVTPPIPLSTPVTPKEDLDHQRASTRTKPQETVRKIRPGDGMLPMPVAVPSPKQKHRRPDPGPAAVLDSTRRREGGTPPATAAGNQLLAEHVAAYPYTPPRDVQRWTSTAIEKQLAQGVDPEMVRIGLSLLRSDQKANPQRDIGPGLLPKYVDQALRGIRPGNIRPRGQENALDVLARVKAKMQAGDGGFRTAAPFDADRIVDSFAVNYGETA